MLITYVHRHGWRYTSLAFLNFLLWFGVTIQLGGIMAMGSSRTAYSEISSQMGFHEGTLMGSVFLFRLLGSSGFWVLALVLTLTLVKEFFRLTLSRRLMINGSLFLASAGLSAYVITVLYYLPVQSVGN